MIRVTASLRQQPSGAEILKYDSTPIKRHELRENLEAAFACVCDEHAETVDEGNCVVLVRVERATLRIES